MDLTPDNVVGSLSARATNTYDVFECIHKHGRPIAGHHDVYKYSEISTKYLNSETYTSETRKLFILNTIMYKKWYHRLSGEEFIANMSPSFLNVFFFIIRYNIKFNADINRN